MKFIQASTILFLCSCSNLEDLPERVDRLRAIGVAADQPVYKASSEDSQQSGTLTFYLASPSDIPLEVEALELESEQLELKNVAVNDIKKYAEMNILSVSAAFDIPQESSLVFFPLGYSSLEYAIRFSQESDEERLRGKVKIYPVNNTPDIEQSVQIQITYPNKDDGIDPGKTDLKAELSNTTDEHYRISWLVADGKIEKIRSIETEWEEYSGDRKTIIATVRGLESLNFHYHAIDINLKAD